MAERASLNQVIQWGTEATPGTSVAVTKRPQTLSISPTVAVNIDEFRPAGTKYRAMTAINKEWVTASLSGRGSYTEIIYVLSSVVNTAVVTTAGTITKLWTFTPSNTVDDVPKTFTFEHGSSVRADKFSYGIIPEFGMKFTRNSIEISGSLFGQRLTDGATLSPQAGRQFTATTALTTTLTSAALFLATDVGALVTGTGIPANTYIASFQTTSSVTLSQAGTAAGSTTITVGAVTSVPLVPILATQVSVYIDNSAAALGTTKLTRAISADFKLSGRYGPIWVLDAANQSFIGHVETEPSAMLTLSVEADTQGMALLTDMRASTTKFIRVEAVGATNSIESGQAYTFTLDFAGQIKSTGGFGDSDGLYTIDWSFVSVNDATWGKPFEFRVRNAVVQLQ